MIQLNRIQLQGFKSIREMDFSLNRLNVLIGANGAGKSNFLSFFQLLNYMTSSSLQLYIGKEGGANDILHYGVKQTPYISCTLDFETDAGKNMYHMKLVNVARDTLIFADEQISFTKKASRTPMQPFSLGAGHQETKMLENDLGNQSFSNATTARVIRNIMNQFRFYQFHDTSQEARIKNRWYIGNNLYLLHDAGNLAPFLYMLKNTKPKYYQKIVTTIQQIAPFFDDFVLRPTVENNQTIMLEWKERNTDLIFGPHQLSDGTLRMMALVTLLLQPNLPPLICIDEPELGLHPYAIEVLASLLKAASMESQIIVATQSVPLVDVLEVEDLVVVNRSDKQSTFERLNAEKLEHWLTEYSLSELWEKNVIGGRPSR